MFPKSENEEKNLRSSRRGNLIDDRARRRISTNSRVMIQLLTNPVMVENSYSLLIHNLSVLRSSSHQSLIRYNFLPPNRLT
jgi:hypothetical protein